jgi:hypothetical protein
MLSPYQSERPVRTKLTGSKALRSPAELQRAEELLPAEELLVLLVDPAKWANQKEERLVGCSAGCQTAADWACQLTELAKMAELYAQQPSFGSWLYAPLPNDGQKPHPQSNSL